MAGENNTFLPGQMTSDDKAGNNAVKISTTSQEMTLPIHRAPASAPASQQASEQDSSDDEEEEEDSSDEEDEEVAPAISAEEVMRLPLTADATYVYTIEPMKPFVRDLAKKVVYTTEDSFGYFIARKIGYSWITDPGLQIIYAGEVEWIFSQQQAFWARSILKTEADIAAGRAQAGDNLRCRGLEDPEGVLKHNEMLRVQKGKRSEEK